MPYARVSQNTQFLYKPILHTSFHCNHFVSCNIGVVRIANFTQNISVFFYFMIRKCLTIFQVFGFRHIGTISIFFMYSAVPMIYDLKDYNSV